MLGLVAAVRDLRTSFRASDMLKDISIEKPDLGFSRLVCIVVFSGMWSKMEQSETALEAEKCPEFVENWPQPRPCGGSLRNPRTIMGARMHVL